MRTATVLPVRTVRMDTNMSYTQANWGNLEQSFSLASKSETGTVEHFETNVRIRSPHQSHSVERLYLPLNVQCDRGIVGYM